MEQNSESIGIKVKCLVQQCLSAKLFTKLEDQINKIEPEYVEIGRGAVLFICFMKDAQESDLEKLGVKLSETSFEDSNKRVGILDLPGDILIIPQATLGGKLKGKMIQYHNNVNKDIGAELYSKFVEICKKYAGESSKWMNGNCKIFNGTYGIRQVYSTLTNGPYLHIIEF